MTAELSALVITAASIGFLHTVLGPDHYLPFIMMSWARKWSRVKTIIITFLCGLGHIASSVVLGLIGVSMGLAVKKLELIESSRGNIAAWLLIAFGLAYLVWGLRRAYRNRPHIHTHVHAVPSSTGGVHTGTGTPIVIIWSTVMFTTAKALQASHPGRCLPFLFSGLVSL